MRIVLAQRSVCAALFYFSAPSAGVTPTLAYTIIAQHPHDSAAFTEGLAIDNGHLIESTGRYGESQLIIRDLSSGRLLKSTLLGPSEFGEGVAVVGNRFFQLTWKSERGHIYDTNLESVGEFHYFSEGWGLTYDGHELLRSDGSSRLKVHDPYTFSELRQIPVRDGEEPITRLNELEFAEGKIYANVWLTDRIAIISPANGTVEAWLDLSPLKQLFPKPANWNPTDNVLNGIAYDPKKKHFWVTGKCWPVIYEIKVGPVPQRKRSQTR